MTIRRAVAPGSTWKVEPDFKVLPEIPDQVDRVGPRAVDARELTPAMAMAILGP